MNEPGPTATSRPATPRDPETGIGAALELQSVTASYGSVIAIRDVSIHVRAGEVVCLLGRNGAGKTTTQKAACGLVHRRAGQVLVAGKDVSGLPVHERSRLGLQYVPEGRSAFGHLTVAENLRLVRNPVADPFDIFPALKPLALRKARLLSGGEHQMLVLARALCARPRVLMVDELSLGLAPLVVDQLARALRSAADEQRMAVLVVEQQLKRALRMADRAYVLQHGTIVLEGNASGFLADPALVEAAYLGMKS